MHEYEQRLLSHAVELPRLLGLVQANDGRGEAVPADASNRLEAGRKRRKGPGFEGACLGYWLHPERGSADDAELSLRTGEQLREIRTDARPGPARRLD